jgi:heme/copper-type cytochrome/quinol oxidase subunit 2
VRPLPWSCLCAAVCALGIACTGDSPAQAPTIVPSANAAAVLPAPTSPPAATQTPAEPTATPEPEPAVAPTALPPALVGNPAPSANPPAPAPSAEPAARPAPVAVRLTLETRDQTFAPHQIHGNFDDTVTVTLSGSDKRHSFTVPEIGIDQTIDEGKTVVVSFVLPLALGGPAAEGIFPFYCRFHGSPTSGMHGFLILH